MTTTGRPTVDFSHHDAEFHQNRHAEWAKLRQCPVAYNPRFGGFWVVSGYDEVAQVSRDGETFSSKYLAEPEDGISYLGITGVPRIKGIPPAGIAEVEGPVHQALRRVLNPFLLPLAVERLEPLMRDVTRWFVDQKIGDGAADLVLDITNPVPAVLTMQLIGLPCDTWQHYAELFHATVALRPDDPEYARAIGRVPEMIQSLLAEADDRRRHPRDDLLSRLVEMEVDGQALSDSDISSVLWNLVGGGLDTTTSLTSLSLYHLDERPELRQALIEQPDLIVPATEEFLRYFSVNETLTRTCTRDTVLGGQELQRGDHVMISWLAANRDPAQFESPDQVILDRTPNRHLAFGVGPHRCIGMHLARTMFQILLGEILARIPDYRVDRAATRFYQGNPELTGVVSMPATFTPGPRVGPAERPF